MTISTENNYSEKNLRDRLLNVRSNGGAVVRSGLLVVASSLLFVSSWQILEGICGILEKEPTTTYSRGQNSHPEKTRLFPTVRNSADSDQIPLNQKPKRRGEKQLSDRGGNFER